MRKRWLAAGFPVLLMGCAGTFAAEKAPPAGTEKAPAASPAEALRDDLDRLFAEAGLPTTVVACRVLDLETGQGTEARVLTSVRADLPLVPASTMKLMVTAACWDRLGPEWRIRTTVGRLAPQKKGVPPDLVVLGGGDPNFSGRFYAGDPLGAFRRWAGVLKKRGVAKLGRVLLDDGLFEPTVVHPNWPADQREKWYEAPVGALNLNDNCVDVHLRPGPAVGEPARIGIEPPMPYVRLENAVRTVAAKKDHRYSLAREAVEGGLRVRARGGYWIQAPPLAQPVNRTVTDPALFFGHGLATALRAEGIAVAGPVERTPVAGPKGLPEDFTADLVHTSSLGTVCRVANARSQGLYAECLMKLLGAFAADPQARYGAVAETNRPRLASWETGRRELARWLGARGIEAEGCRFDDGSGLSKSNRLTVLAVTQTLALMHRTHGQPFVDTLARPGEGSLAKRMRGTAAEGRVWGKTGYVRGVSALSGYVRTRSGRMLAYAILMSGVPWGELWKARDVQDRVCLRLLDYP